MVQPDEGGELSPEGSVTVAFLCLGAAVAIGRWALRQRAIDRAKEGKEIGSLDEIFSREYKGEPKSSWLEPADDMFRPEGWYMWMFVSIVLGGLGIALAVLGVGRLL
ncbi:MAG TPA: hypothetical protein VFC19_12750 [Candidatus Limnocylindrales bacterium]|nr:hypothetical protein [Candidatus Limnocylindrales bacterium]